MNICSNIIYFCDQSIFSIITPVFSVTWSSEIIIICWFAAQNISETTLLLAVVVVVMMITNSLLIYNYCYINYDNKLTFWFKSFIGQVCLHMRGISYSDRSATVWQNDSIRTGHRQQNNNIQMYKMAQYTIHTIMCEVWHAN